MKAKQLKGKEIFIIEFECDKCKNIGGVKCSYFDPKDVKLAVKWLKEQIEKECDWKRIPSSMKFTKIIHFIDEAFPDLQDCPK